MNLAEKRHTHRLIDIVTPEALAVEKHTRLYRHGPGCIRPRLARLPSSIRSESSTNFGVLSCRAQSIALTRPGVMLWGLSFLA